MSHKPVPECATVHYTLHGQHGKAVFLTKSLAEDYIVRMKLSDAIIKLCYTEEQMEYFINTPQMKVISNGKVSSRSDNNG